MMGFKLQQALVRRAILCATLVLGAAASTHAADALNGKTLYLNGPVGGGTACASCHGPTPADNVNGILAAADTPSVISAAFAANKGGMGALFNGKFTSAEIADLAAFIGNPGVGTGPVASLLPASLSFGGVTLGQTSTALGTTLSNTGSGPLNVTAISLSGSASSEFSISGGTCTAGGAVAAGANCTVQLRFSPTTVGSRSATLTIAHNGTGASSTVSLGGTGNAVPQATVGLSATSVNFGALITNTTSTLRTVTVSNSGAATLNLSGITLGGANSAFITRGGTCATATPVAAGASCTVTFLATPTTAGAFAASLTLTSNASNPSVMIGLSGSGAAPAPAISPNPSAVAFGAHTVGSGPKSQGVTLTNSGNVALGLTSYAVTGSAQVTLGAPNGCGAALAIGASCTVPLVFTPTAAGAVTATLTVLSNAATLQVPITASGTLAPVAAPSLSENGPLVFADTTVGVTSATRTIELRNTGTASLTIATLVLSGSHPGDFVRAGTCAVGATVNPAGACTLITSLRPTAAGARSADMVLVTNGGTQFTVGLSGNGVAVVGVGVLTIAPQTFNFGAAIIGGTAPTKRFTLSNTGTASITLLSGSMSGPFARVTDPTGCAAFPITLAPGVSCDLVLSYVPAVAGSSSGSMVIQGEASASWTIALAGQASVAPPPPPPAPPQNSGGGGCSSVRDGKDPVLALLVLLAFGVIGWRRRSAKLPARRVEQ